MRTAIVTYLLLLSCTSSMAQLFSKKDIAIHQGIMTFHNPVLNNKNNANKKVSWVTELDKNFYLRRFTSVNAGLGLGNYKNMDDRFGPYESSNFFRMKLGLVLHLPQHYTPHNLSPKAFNPFVKVAYNFDIADQHFKQLGGNKISSSLRLGVGFIVRLNHYAGIMYEFSHNQRVAMDYRTFFQHTFGLVINLEAPARRY